jgi:cytochrome b pre-mRNA-processing protein 3
MILPGFRRQSQGRTIRALYGAIVAQARRAVFYADYGVPDTVEGRFDLIVLHLVLLLRRVTRNDRLSRDLGQELFDEFCRDLDANLREMGVGDLAVPKRMRGFAEAFYGRQAAYLGALAAPDPRDFAKALARNIFQSGVEEGEAARLAHYAREVLRQLEAQADADLAGGQVTFPAPEAFARERA